jgi:hypothetical protein
VRSHQLPCSKRITARLHHKADKQQLREAFVN